MKDMRFVRRAGCPLCGAQEQEIHIAFQDIPVLRCCACGFLYSEYLMSQEALAEYYRTDFGSQRHLQGQYINGRINADVIRRLMPFVKGMSLLDVGAGYGFLLQQMRVRHGVEGVGVELSEQESRYGKSLGLDIRNGSLDAAGLSHDAFDLVTSFEVIEHVADPAAFVRELVHYVKPGGHLLVMTDNFQSRVARELGPSFPKWIPHAHISHFGPKTLERLFGDMALEVVDRFSYTPWELWARYYYAKVKGMRPSPEDAFKLSEVLAAEMHGQFRLFQMRRLINVFWARRTGQPNLDGALMFLLGQRRY